MLFCCFFCIQYYQQRNEEVKKPNPFLPPDPELTICEMPQVSFAGSLDQNQMISLQGHSQSAPQQIQCCPISHATHHS